MKKILIPILLLPLAFTSCKKHQIKKETKRVAGTFRGQMESYHQESHSAFANPVIDTAYNSVYGVDVRIEKAGDDEIQLYWDGAAGLRMKYAGHNILSTYSDYDKHFSSSQTLVYYPSTDSIFIVVKNRALYDYYPFSANITNSYFKGKRVSD